LRSGRVACGGVLGAAVSSLCSRVIKRVVVGEDGAVTGRRRYRSRRRGDRIRRMRGVRVLE